MSSQHRWLQAGYPHVEVRPQRHHVCVAIAAPDLIPAELQSRYTLQCTCMSCRYVVRHTMSLRTRRHGRSILPFARLRIIGSVYPGLTRPGWTAMAPITPPPPAPPPRCEVHLSMMPIHSFRIGTPGWNVDASGSAPSVWQYAIVNGISVSSASLSQTISAQAVIYSLANELFALGAPRHPQGGAADSGLAGIRTFAPRPIGNSKDLLLSTSSTSFAPLRLCSLPRGLPCSPVSLAVTLTPSVTLGVLQAGSYRLLTVVSHIARASPTVLAVYPPRHHGELQLACQSSQPMNAQLPSAPPSCHNPVAWARWRVSC